MQIYYCNKCGKRLSIDDALRVEQASVVKAEEIFCSVCTAQAQSGAEAAAPVQPPSGIRRRSASGGQTRPTVQTAAMRSVAPRPVSSGRRSGSGGTSRPGSGGSARPGRQAEAHTPTASGPGMQKAVFIAIGAGVALGLGILVLVRGGAEKPGKKVGQTEEVGKTSVNPTLPVKPEPRQPEIRPTPRGEPEPKPQPAERELTPKERYELKQKEKPPEPKPDTTVAMPADTAWQDLFNGQNLDGWVQAKGKWRVEDGAMVGEGPERGATLVSAVSYSDFEFTAKINLDVGRYSEVSVRELSFTFGVDWPQKQVWREVKITARGKKVNATIDGAPLGLAECDQNGLSGTLGFYVSKGGLLKVKDVRLRKFPGTP